MPQVAIADLEIHLPTMDLVVATHGRGIYKINLKPIQKLMNQQLPKEQDYLFEVAEIQRPWFNSNGGEPDYRSFEKANFSFWLTEAQTMQLSIIDKANKEIWSMKIYGSKGLNEFRWDLTLSKRTSDEPYFVHYDKFIEAGKYTLKATIGNKQLEQPINVLKGVSPYIE
jgi:hypothetical protein